MSNVKCQLSNVSRGFTLIELLLSVAIITIIAGMSVPVYQSFQVRNDLDIAAVTFVQTARRAQTLSQAVDGDISWGARAGSGNITLFKGMSYALRDTAYDEIFDMPSNIAVSGTQEYVFTKFTGLPQTTGTLTLMSVNNEMRSITVNGRGMASY